MTREEIVAAFDELRILLKGMKIPEHRRDNPFWLEKNLGGLNEAHTNYNPAMQVIKKLLAAGARSEPK